MFEFLTLPERTTKPRESGLTHVLDKGLSLEQVRQFVEVAGDYVDIVKLGWGTAVVTPNVKEKIALYQSFGIPVCFGGTFFEVCLRQNKLEEYLALVRECEHDLRRDLRRHRSTWTRTTSSPSCAASPRSSRSSARSAARTTRW